ncbi:MAG: ClbS/DfsB family four-helix bundle protein [Anaerolineales bacterium]|nr:ClbS/DfsB family four-helix bundle protein [Anaerolineales bacterium]
MNNKTQIIAALKGEFNRWEELLNNLSEEQISAPNLIVALSIKDVIAHLHAWQQLSIARLEAAQWNREPELPQWLAGEDPESEDNLNTYNERIYQERRAQGWTNIRQLWKEGFLRFLELAETTPEQDLLEVGRYSWLKEYPLSAVLLGWHEHHQEHFEDVSAAFR